MFESHMLTKQHGYLALIDVIFKIQPNYNLTHLQYDGNAHDIDDRC